MDKLWLRDAAERLSEELKEDILERYNNPKHWDTDILKDFFIDKGVTEEEENVIMECLL